MHQRVPQRASRVRCTQVNRLTHRPCLAERILDLSDTCFVCGGAVYERVGPSAGDIPGIYADLAVLIADLLQVDPSPEAAALVPALAIATEAHAVKHQV